jgi:hypothetical protein
MSKNLPLILIGMAFVLLVGITILAWNLLIDRNQSGDIITDVTRQSAAPLPPVIGTPQPDDGGMMGETDDLGPTPTPRIVGDLSGVQIELEIPPTLDELLERYPQLDDLMVNLDLRDDERLNEVYPLLLELYDNEGLLGLHEFMLGSGVLEALNFDSVYVDLILAYEEDGLEGLETAARNRRLLTIDDQIRAVLILDTEDISGIQPRLNELDITVLAHYGNKIEVGIPLEKLTEQGSSQEAMAQLIRLAHLPNVVGVKAPEASVTSRQLRVGEGVALTGVSAWHQAGFTGTGLKIGIIDPDGFQGFRALLGSDLPPASRIFVPDWQDPLFLDRQTGPHGTACAEIVHEMAPDAELYLVQAASSYTQQQAIDWLLANRVNIISFSASSLTDPIDGTGRLVQLAQKALDQGVLWVNSSGNFAESHLAMTFADSDGDSWHEFPHGQNLLQIEAGDDIAIGLSWNDVSPGANENYDLYIFRETAEGGDVQLFASSREAQRGRAGDVPAEYINIDLPAGRRYFVAIQAKDISYPGQLRLLTNSRFAYSMPDSSLGSPADGRRILAVGATYWQDDSLKPYSSQGPTSDGRIKPDIVAPSGISNVSYDTFGGTSASAPHVAGAAALVMQAYPGISAPDVRDYLLQHALDLGMPGIDNEFGVGRLRLPPPPAPGAAPPAPQPGSATAVIHRITTQHNVSLSGIPGMRIQADFTVNGYQEQNGRLAATFYDRATNAALMDANASYVNDSGQVAVWSDFTPRFASTRFSGMELFMPYGELDRPSGRHQLQYRLRVAQENGTVVATSQPVHFWVELAGDYRSQASLSNVRVAHNVVRDNALGMDIYVDFAIANHLDQQGQVIAYFYFDGPGNRALRDFNGQYRTDSGNVAVGRWFTPGSQKARYDGFLLFMPYAELHMEPGYLHRLKMNIVIWGGTEWRQLQVSNWIQFWYDTR